MGSRCHQNHSPFESVEECLASEGKGADPSGGLGNAAMVELLRGQDGNFAQHGYVPPDKGGFGGKVVLTFDDGPDMEHTPEILTILKQYGIKATFFVHGQQLDQDGAMELVQQMQADGHIIGNHTESHVLLGDGRGTRPEMAEAQISGTHDRLTHINDSDDPRFMRFPGGSANSGSIAEAEGDGYTVTGWHVDSSDWCFDDTIKKGGEPGTCAESVFPDPGFQGTKRDDFAGNLVENTKKFDGGILLFHDTRQFTLENLEEAIVALQKADFEFTNLDDEAMLPILNAQAEELTPEIPVRPSPLVDWPNP